MSQSEKVTPYRRKPTTSPKVSPPSGAASSDSSGALVFGCGYLGKSVAESLLASGTRVWATTRSREKAALLSETGIEPVLADWCEPATLRDLPRVERVLVAVSYDRTSSRSRWQSQVGGLTNLLDKLHPTTQICYISTTGVYHQTDGSWIDESSPTSPQRAGGKAHLEAEACLASASASGQRTILRLSGIYGPGRVPRAADVIAGKPIASMQEGYLNLIHVQDATRAVIQSWNSQPHSLYLVSDDEPVRRGDFYGEIAKQTNSPEPQFVIPESGSPKSARSESNKRIRNSRMKSNLIPTLRFPSYREGLAQTLAAITSETKPAN